MGISFFMLSQHNYNKAGTTSGLVVVLHSWSPQGLSRPFAVVLPLGFCLAESLACYHICCFPSYCSGITSTWTPLRFPKCSEIMHLTNEGLRRHQCSVSALDTRLPEWPKSFIKSSFNELARLCLSSHFAGGLITSSLLINEDAAPGRGRSEVISVASDEQKGWDCSDSGACMMLNDAHMLHWECNQHDRCSWSWECNGRVVANVSKAKSQTVSSKSRWRKGTQISPFEV